MGYQQSFIKFRDIDTLKAELSKYVKREGYDQAAVFGVVKTIKNLAPFKKGELALVVGGERYTQRNPETIKEELGIENVQSVVFIDNPYYWDMSNGGIEKLLDEHFENMSREEYESLID